MIFAASPAAYQQRDEKGRIHDQFDDFYILVHTLLVRPDDVVVPVPVRMTAVLKRLMPLAIPAPGLLEWNPDESFRTFSILLLSWQHQPL